MLAGIYKVGIFNPDCCAKIYPNGSSTGCREQISVNVTSRRHRDLSRTVAESGAVLLRNEGDVLPIGDVKTIAVIGPASTAGPYLVPVPNATWNHWAGAPTTEAWHQGDYYSGGGSGHVSAPTAVTPLVGIQAVAAKRGIKVISAPSNITSEVVPAVADADLLIFVGATTSGESQDRANLYLDDGFDQLLNGTVDAYPEKRSVVVSIVPAAVLMKWRFNVSSILLMYLPGQESGNALANVLFGEVNPSGRLIESYPQYTDDAIPHTNNTVIEYTEDLHVGYRSLERKNSYAFGHGLSYTRFGYDAPTVRRCDAGCVFQVRVLVHNNGTAPGRDVPQLYLEFDPKESENEPIGLKGFKKTGTILPGASQLIIFELYPRDLSVWLGAWTRMRNITALTAASSRDFRGSIALPHWTPSTALRDSIHGTDTAA